MAPINKPRAAATNPPKKAEPLKQQSVEVFVLEGSKKTLQHVPFSKIVVQEKDYAFREGSGTNPFSKKALQPLKESIMQHKGVHTPILLRARGDGTYLLVDGHRRYFALKALIEDGVQGFTADMTLPAFVMAVETSELVTVATGLSANIDRQPLAYEGRLKATKKLYELGMPTKSIAQLLGVSESTVDRDLKLVSDDQMMAHVRSHAIQATFAASLLAAAAKHTRREDLMAHFEQWLEATKTQIAAEVAALKAQDAELTMPVSKTWPQSRLTPELIKHWRIALEKNQPLVDPGFRYKAMVRSDGGVQRIEVDGLNMAVDKMTAGQVAKLFERFVDLTAELEPILESKMAAQESEASEPAVKVSPGQQRLQELGWGQFVSGPDVDVEDDDPTDYEPDTAADDDDFAGPWGPNVQPVS